MEKGTWKVTLADGTELDGLALNGNNFISATEIDPSVFSENLTQVTIEGPEGADDAGLRGEHTNMELIRCELDEGLGGYAFVLRDQNAAELRELKLRGDIEYLAMMTGIDLE